MNVAGTLVKMRIWSLGTLARADRRDAEKRATFEALVQAHWSRFYHYAYRLCRGNADDAEDLLGETLLDAYRGFEQFRGDGFDRWFFRMLTTNRIDMTRRAKVRRALSLDGGWSDSQGERHPLEIPDARQAPERTLDDLYSEPMQKALDSLPESFRAPVLLCDVDGMDYEEIARALEIPLGTVRSRIHRARSRMRAMLETLGWSG